MSKVYVILLNYRSWQSTIEAAESVLASDYDNYQLIIVDNNSPDDSYERLAAWARQRPDTGGLIEYTCDQALSGGDITAEGGRIFPPLILIQTGANLGYAGGNNVALRMVAQRNESAFVWILNPDVTVSPSALRHLAVQAQPGEVLGVVMRDFINPSEVVFLGGFKIYHWLGTVLPVRRVQETSALDYISGSALFTHVDTFKRFGFFPEEYFLYWEETDWCTRVLRGGYTMRVCLAAECFDKHGTSISRFSPWAEGLYATNYLKYTEKNYPKQVARARTGLGVRLLAHLVRFRFSRAGAVARAILGGAPPQLSSD